jgi:hypothetical protein
LTKSAARLSLPHPPETFICSGSGELNASCCSVAPDDLHYLTVHGELFTLCEEGELLFIIGHELGHMGLHNLQTSSVRNELAHLMSVSSSRACEISADRIGLLTCRDFNAAVTALLKLHTSLNSSMLHSDIGALVEALTEQASEISARHNGWQAHQDHPFVAFRVWALQRFVDSDAYKRVIGIDGGTPISVVDQEIATRFEMLGGGALRVAQAERLSQAVLWLTTLVLSELPAISANARTELAHVVGKIPAQESLLLLTRCGAEEIRARAEASVARVISARPADHAEIASALDSLCAALCMDMKTTESWVLLQESADSNRPSDDAND